MLPDFLKSSTGEGLAMRAKAILLALVPVLTALFGLTEIDLVKWIDAIVLLIALALWIYGEARRVIFKKNHLGRYKYQ